MKFDIGYYIVKGKNSTFLKGFNTVIKPNIGDDVIIDGEFYTVKSVCIDYDRGNVHAFIKKIKRSSC